MVWPSRSLHSAGRGSPGSSFACRSGNCVEKPESAVRLKEHVTEWRREERTLASEIEERPGPEGIGIESGREGAWRSSRWQRLRLRARAEKLAPEGNAALVSGSKQE